ncbi:hypothetical protein Acr_04g0000870 [Actinidia rufa]|uniref:Uncharacterized protein n=1 Tax=Actinidia rufa TaxID=165716 RepID=A0A7J0EHG5_9ERIC|nr:hypothetical protein Acr_04g0000870 [Actinidia rufa]
MFEPGERDEGGVGRRALAMSFQSHMDFFMALLALRRVSFSASTATMSLCYITDLALSATKASTRNTLITVLLFAALVAALMALLAHSIVDFHRRSGVGGRPFSSCQLAIASCNSWKEKGGTHVFQNQF